MNKNENVENKILFLYGKGEGNNLNEKDFKIEKGKLETIKEFGNNLKFWKEKKQDFILEKKFEKGKYSILLLSSELDLSKIKIKKIYGIIKKIFLIC